MKTTALLCALSLAGEPSLAFADDGPPSRIGNIYGGFDHQPTQSEVWQRERAARINLDSNELKRNTAILDELYRELESKAAAASVGAH